MKQITKNLNSNILKTIAVISMTIDHIAWAIFPGFSMHPIAIIMHILGRIACPIFCYFMVQGYIHTKNFKKYFSRILIFALISHIPYVFYLSYIISSRLELCSTSYNTIHVGIQRQFQNANDYYVSYDNHICYSVLLCNR